MNNKFYTKQENILISSIMDKYRIHKKDNRNTSTNFLDSAMFAPPFLFEN